MATKTAGQAMRHPRMNALPAADCESPFRFLDLPPELRNMIYEDVLKILPWSTTPNLEQGRSTKPCLEIPRKPALEQGRPKKHCYPEILRTCRLVHKEAEDVLYSGELELDMKLVVCDGGAELQTICQHPHPESITCSINNLPITFDGSSKLFTSPSTIWPMVLGKISRLYLSIDLCTRQNVWLSNSAMASRENDKTLQLNHLLFDLSNFLNGHGRLQDVEMELKYYGDADNKTMRDVLAPLRLLPLEYASVHNYRGWDSERLKGLMRSMGPPQVNTDGSWKTADGMDWLEASYAVQRVICLRVEAERKKFIVNHILVENLESLTTRLRNASCFQVFIKDHTHQWLKGVVLHAVESLYAMAEMEFDKTPYRELWQDMYARKGKQGLLMDRK